MLLRIFKSNSTLNFILIPLIGAGIWIGAFVSGKTYPFFPGEDKMPLFHPISRLIGENNFLSTGLALAILLVLTFLALRLNMQYSFIRIRTFLPAGIFVLITSGLKTLHHLHPVYFAALCLFFVIDNIFAALQDQRSLRYAFNAGFFIGLGALFYLHTIAFLPIVWIGFTIVKKNRQWRDFALPLLGAVVPLLLGVSYYFLVDRMGEIPELIQQNIFTHNYFIRSKLEIQVYIGYMICLILLGSAYMLLHSFDEKKSVHANTFRCYSGCL